MGPWVLINARWYKGRDPSRKGFFSESNEVVIEIGVFGNDHN